MHEDGLPQNRDSFAGTREGFWFAHALLNGEHEEESWKNLGNKVIRRTDYTSRKQIHFSLLAAVLLLVKCNGTLEKESRNALIRFISEIASTDLPQFRGGNDNFPAMTTASLVLAGQVLENATLVDRGKELIAQAEALLRRRGCLSEYNSPTYSVVSLHAFAELANCTTDTGIRASALKIEERIWSDLLAHYHPQTYKIAGPHSRAYMDSCLAHDTLASFALYAVLGDGLIINPMKTVFAGKEIDPRIHIHLDLQFTRICGYFVISGDLHCPEHLLKLATDKSYPYEVNATTEVTAFPEPNPLAEFEVIYPGGYGSIRTVMEPDFALGTTDREFASGVSTTAFHILYRKRRPVRAQGDVGVVFSKYISNEKTPKIEHRHAVGANPMTQLHDEGRKVAFQEDRGAVVIYTPKLICTRNISSLKLSVIFPAHFEQVEAIWLGGREVPSNGSENHVLIEDGGPNDIVVKDGPLWLGLRPLALTDCGRKACIRIEMLDSYLLVSFYNYEGPTRDFSSDEIYSISNGFVAEVRTCDEIENVADIRGVLTNAELNDRRQRWNRLISYKRPGMAFECECCPNTESMRYVTLNGVVPKRPEFFATGFKTLRQ